MIVDVFQGFLPVSKGIHLGLSHDRDALVEQFLNAFCRFCLGRVGVVEGLVAIRDLGAFEVNIILDHESKSTKRQARHRCKMPESGAEGKAGELRVGAGAPERLERLGSTDRQVLADWGWRIKVYDVNDGRVPGLRLQRFHASSV